jgi:hypothetical protein
LALTAIRSGRWAAKILLERRISSQFVLYTLDGEDFDGLVYSWSGGAIESEVIVSLDLSFISFENEKERQQALAVTGCCLIACAHGISAPPHLSPARSEVDIGDRGTMLVQETLPSALMKEHWSKSNFRFSHFSSCSDKGRWLLLLGGFFLT